MNENKLVRTLLLAGIVSTLCFNAHGAAGDVDISFALVRGLPVRCMPPRFNRMER